MNLVQADCTGTETDFKVGELRVWRGWRIDSLGRLTGMHQRAIWLPGGIGAECRADRAVSFTFNTYLAAAGYPSIIEEARSSPEKGHASPDPACTCGVYCYYDPREELDRYGISKGEPNILFGVAEVWGKVLIGEKGLRAEHARPVALVTPSRYWDHTEFVPRRKKRVERERMQRLARNYPDARIYRSARAALRETPLFVPDISEADDPLFWTRSAA